MIRLNTEAAILSRVFEVNESVLTPSVARYVLSMRFSAEDEDRVDELSARARTGVLTEGEAEELDSYLRVGSLLAVMQSKARRRLMHAASNHSPTHSGREDVLQSRQSVG